MPGCNSVEIPSGYPCIYLEERVDFYRFGKLVGAPIESSDNSDSRFRAQPFSGGWLHLPIELKSPRLG